MKKLLMLISLFVVAGINADYEDVSWATLAEPPAEPAIMTAQSGLGYHPAVMTAQSGLNMVPSTRTK